MTNSNVALVTGGSRGIGESICRELAEQGFAIAVNYVSNPSLAEALVTDLRAQDVEAQAIQCNVADPEQVHRLFETTEERLGPVDVLVNNAGVMTLSRLADCPDDAFDDQIAVNLKGVFNTLREAATRINSAGRIINLSTSVVGLKLENYGVYAATKAAVETLSAILSKELRGRQITVNCVAPGPTATDLFLAGKSPELIARLASMNPMERLGIPEDIAKVVAFLASPAGAWVNGQTLRANGGMI